MRYFILSIVCYVLRRLIRLRYSVTIKGKENLKRKNLNKDVGVLFLPNHPAHVDPIFIFLYFLPKFKLRPVVVEYIYRQSKIHFIMNLVKALTIPNFDTSMNELKLKKAKRTLEEITKGLRDKKNYLLYPAGRLKHTGKEIIGGSSAVHTILKGCKNANVVLIRTTGLWGSSFSRVYTGTTPDFKSMLTRGMKCLFRSFIFFMPRRKVLIEIEVAPKDFPMSGSRIEMNKYLEKWYNRYPTKEGIVSEEPVSLISYSPFKEQLLKLPRTEIKKDLRPTKFSTQLEKEIFTEIAKIAKTNEENISLEMDLAQDLGLDSFDITEIITFLSHDYDIENIHPENIQTVKDVLEIAQGTKKIIRKSLEEVLLHKWPKDEKRKNPFLPYGKTIHEAFLHVCTTMNNTAAIADDLIGAISYKKLKIAALAIAQKLKEYPGKHVGILLPASVGAYLMFFATLLANKIPVMLNWTLGPRYLNHMMQVTHSNIVISSWRFLEKLSNVAFGRLTKKVIYVEDVLKKISTMKKISAFFQSMKSTKKILKNLKLDKISKDDIAVILFTSGSESNPKGVPLSHENIMFNQRGAINYVGMDFNDIFYCFLPPFHSFGLAMAGLLPILSGIRVAFYPDPTDNYSLAEGIQRWQATIVCSPPSFFKNLFLAATEEQLKTIRLFVAGAEKTPKELYEKVKSFKNGKLLIEGYGITECSSVITVNKTGNIDYGVGKPLENIEIRIIDPETEQEIDRHKEGEICIKALNVFKGYLGLEKNPFIQINNEKYYKSGDLGYLDKDGNLILSGRLKRFSKVAGEMVSLGAIEEVITDEVLRRTSLEAEGPIVAVCAKEAYENHKTKLVLFSTVPLTKKEVNMILKEAGFSNLVKISDVKNIDVIPLMGTGKTDYRYLQKMIE